MIRFHGIIFDLDGVLCSTDSFHYQAWKETVTPYGIPCDEKINAMLRGVSRKESLEILLRNANRTLTEKEKDEILEKKNNLYVEKLEALDMKSLLPGVLETLLQLKGYGVSIAVGSSSKNARTILCKLGICHIFDAIVDGTEIERSKPDPEVFIKAAIKLSLSPSVCAVIEDAKAGIMAAKAGGFTAIAIGDATKCGLADYCIDTISEILTIE